MKKIGILLFVGATVTITIAMQNPEKTPQQIHAEWMEVVATAAQGRVFFVRAMYAFTKHLDNPAAELPSAGDGGYAILRNRGLMNAARQIPPHVRQALKDHEASH